MLISADRDEELEGGGEGVPVLGDQRIGLGGVPSTSPEASDLISFESGSARAP